MPYLRTFLIIMRLIICICLALSTFSSFSQSKVEGTELGIDGFFGASSFGGSFGVGVKYGFLLNENLIVGPSIRYQRYWANSINTTATYAHNTYGLGGFVHMRFGNALFVGTEIEFMRIPYNPYFAMPNGQRIAPAAFVGGGFSREFNESVRINAGVFYDLIDSPASPFRQGYFMKRANGSFIPLIYRIAFFFPLS